MIPKTIHYCWFGNNPKPKSVLKCIASWKKYCPDYEIIEWNESNIDVNMNLFTKQAYEAKAWGFVPDYLRLWIIYNHGGLYLDTDVEMVKNFDPLLNNKVFGGFEEGLVEKGLYVALGLGFGAEAGNEFIKKHMEVYDNLVFTNEDGTHNKLPAPAHTTKLLLEYGLDRYSDTIQNCGEFTVYPTDYFCPKQLYTGQTKLTENSYSIHQFDASWFDDSAQKEKLDQWKKYRKIDFIHNLTHLPNRVAMTLLGKEHYEKLKQIIKRG